MLTVADLVVQFQTKLDPVFKGIDKLSAKLDELASSDVQIKVKIDDSTRQDIEAIADDLNRIASTVDTVSSIFVRGFDVIDDKLGNAAEQMETFLQSLEGRLPKAIETVGGKTKTFLDYFVERSSPALFANITGLATAVSLLALKGFDLKKAFGFVIDTGGGGLTGIASFLAGIAPKLLSWVTIGGLLLKAATTGVDLFERFISGKQLTGFQRVGQAVTSIANGLTKLNFSTQIAIERFTLISSTLILVGSTLGKITFGLSGFGAALLPILAGFGAFGALFRGIAARVNLFLVRWRANIGDGRAQTQLLSYYLRDMYSVVKALAEVAKPLADAIRNASKGKFPDIVNKITTSMKNAENSLMRIEDVLTKLIKLLSNELTTAIDGVDKKVKQVTQTAESARGPPGGGSKLKQLLTGNLGSALTTSLKGLAAFGSDIAQNVGGFLATSLSEGFVFAGNKLRKQARAVFAPITTLIQTGLGQLGRKIGAFVLAAGIWKKVFFFDEGLITKTLKFSLGKIGNTLGIALNTGVAATFALLGKSPQMKKALARVGNNLEAIGIKQLGQRIGRVLGGVIPAALGDALKVGSALVKTIGGGFGKLFGVGGSGDGLLSSAVKDFRGATGLARLFKNLGGPGFPKKTSAKSDPAAVAEAAAEASEKVVAAKKDEVSVTEKVESAMRDKFLPALNRAAKGLERTAAAANKTAEAAQKGLAESANSGLLKKIIGGLAGLGGGQSANPLEDLLGGTAGGKRTGRSKLDPKSFAQADVFKKLVDIAVQAQVPLDIVDKLFDEIGNNQKLLKFFQEAAKSMMAFEKGITPSIRQLQNIAKVLGGTSPAFFKLIIALQSISDLTRQGDLFAGLFKSAKDLNKLKAGFGDRLSEVFAQGLRDVAKDPKLASSSAEAAKVIMDRIKATAKAQGLNLGDIFSAKGKSSKAVEASLEKRLAGLIGLREGGELSKGVDKLIKQIARSFSKMPKEVQTALGGRQQFEKIAREIVHPLDYHLKFQSPPRGLLGDVVRSFALMGSTVATEMLKGVGGLRGGLRQYIQEGFGGFAQLVSDMLVAPIQIGLNSISAGLKGLGAAIVAPITGVKKLSAALLNLVPFVGPGLAALSNLFFGTFEKIFGGIFKLIAAVPAAISKMLGQIGQGVKALTNTVFELVRDVSEELYSLALDIQRLGVDATQFDALRRSFRFFGVEVTETAQAIQFMQQNIANVGRGGTELQATLALAGLTLKDIKNLDPATIFLRISEAIEAVGSGSQAANRLLELVGASFSNLRTVLVSGPDALLAALEKVERGGFLITDQDLKAAQDFQQLLIQFNQKITDLKILVLSGIGPVIDDVRQFWEKYGPSYILKVQAAVEAVVRTVLAALTEIAMFVKERYIDGNTIENLKADITALKNFVIGAAKVMFSTIVLFGAKKARDLFRVIWKGIKGLDIGGTFKKVFEAIADTRFGKLFINLGRLMLGWVVKGMTQIIPQAIRGLIEAAGNLLLDQLPGIFTSGARKKFQEFLDNATDAVVSFQPGTFLGDLTKAGASDQIKAQFSEILAGVNDAIDGVEFDGWEDTIKALSSGLDEEITKLKGDSEALAGLLERLKGLGEDLPKEYEEALARIRKRVDETAQSLEKAKRELMDTRKAALSFSDLLPLLTEFQDLQNQIGGNLGDYVEKVDPILVANREWREGTVQMFQVLNEFNAQRENLGTTFQQILAANGVDTDIAKDLEGKLKTILGFIPNALNAYASGDVEAAERIIEAVQRSLGKFNEEAATKLPKAVAELAKFQDLISPSFWLALRVQMSGLTRDLAALQKVIDNAETLADEFGLTLLRSGTNSLLYEADLQILANTLETFGKQKGPEAEKAIRAFGETFGFQFDKNVATRKQLDALGAFINGLITLAGEAGRARQELEKLEFFEDTLSNIFGSDLQDAFDQSALKAVKFKLQLTETLATVKQLAAQNGGEIPDAVLKWLNISKDVKDVYAEIQRRAEAINESIKRIAEARGFADAFGRLDDVLSQGLDSEPLQSFINFQAQAERGAARLRIQLEANRIETEEWFKTLGQQDPRRFLRAVEAAADAGLLTLPADVELKESSIPKIMSVLGEAIQASIDTAVSNEALRALRERVQANLTGPLTGAIGRVLSGLADGSILEAARSAKEAAKEVGQQFSTTLYIISQLGQEIFNNYLDRFLTQMTELIEDGLTRAITNALSSKQVAGAVEGLSEGMQRAIGLGITGLLAALGLILSRLQSQAEAVNDQIDSVVNSTEAVRGVISGDTRIAIKETEDAFRAAMLPVVARLDIIIQLMRQGRGLGAPTSPLAGPTLTAL